ncbi:MAG: helix-turn-helix domain-containing protein [Saprospiraceae bacterium]
MNKLKRGEFFGSHFQKLNFEGFTLTDTEYTHAKTDWHYHENPYFTYLLQGKLFEENKKEAYHLEPGSLLFHNWQDAHYNIKPPQYTRGFHMELNSKWFKKYNVSLTDFEGSLDLKNPHIKSSMNKIFYETKVNDSFSQSSIELLILDIFNKIKSTRLKSNSEKPNWVNNLREIILDTDTDYSLANLSKELNIHPNHLSRGFHKYFGSTLGQYIRQLKLNKAIILMSTNQYSMTELCYKCGFYDQSHFIANFKSIYKTTPTKFLKLIS